ncbi:FIST signal transduction protein [Motiliproteus sp. MSK22-1]|uniref:FIST signal transduction protein n=1 Tax=Motiliproteus sp. MSK22-1 TaxID=1897630 RepID=UPI0009777871|nr:FIST N-terminal domain-containing protein [Motiliproteus sp. MSK22-1]OMH39553.1 hypothetical protein BGP75_02895 [Motiliproteus sp. MSK22-1]
MKAQSIATQASDPYRAGVELGEGLSGLKPEIIFLFSTVHYSESNDLLEGMADGLGQQSALIVGNTGDGYYHQDSCGDIGCVAMGLNSNGAVEWNVVRKQGVKENPDGCLQQAWSELKQKTEGDPDILFMFSDFRTDASLYEKVLREQIPIPVIGGIASDDNQMAGCGVYLNQDCIEDGLVLVSAKGAFKFSIHVGNSISTVGRAGTVERAEGTNIFEIDGLSAMDFIERETGKPVLQSDRGVTSLTILQPESSDIRRLRAIVPDFSVSERSIGLYGGIDQGEQVQVCLAKPAELIAEVRNIANHCREQQFHPSAVLVVSCAGRKWLLGEQIEKEVTELVQGSWSNLPLAGFPSFGEIAPIPSKGGYSENLFHNMTYVLLLLG